LSILARGRRQTEHQQLTRRHRLGQIHREANAVLTDVSLKNMVKSWFINRDITTLQAGYLVRINVNTQHIVAYVGETGARDETDISSSNDSDAIRH
jgi:hypothetical protein